MTTSSDAKVALQRLTDRIEALQLEGRGLRRTIASTGELVQRHERMLDDLKRGIFIGQRRGRFVVWLSTALILIAGVVGYIAYNRVINRPDTSRLGIEQLAPVRPHLLITSRPTGAKIFIDGEARGSTPRLIDAPRSSGPVDLRVQASGYLPRKKTLVVKRAGGVHWHVDFEAAAGKP
jgi:PEGA domain